MHASAFVLLAVVGLAAAQTSSSTAATAATSGTASGCGSQIDLIISTCLGTTKPLLAACTANDWDCLCTQSINVLTCYNNCPSSPDRAGYESTKVANCNAASAYGSSSSSIKATATGSSTASLSSVVAAASTSSTSGSATQTMSASASGSGATNTGAAVANAAVPAGGVLAAVFGLAVLL